MNKIYRIIEPTVAGLIAGGEPACADEREQNPTGGHLFVDSSSEITARFDGGHIHEHGVLAKLTR
jgi:hypothetical protein